ncbi:uncharacterized protein LOC129597202 [Paramacrobiotus metropolitanus]|uniref:uncharacterized protein LOC129597202 n=1 Tax=Paramacrobiotus metropolitanus TaxID=2943436 RepID=UPI002445877A|nr:uncharacterized protein LOC129597202 [Paramacrobiotus metropolitanus]
MRHTLIGFIGICMIVTVFSKDLTIGQLRKTLGHDVVSVQHHTRPLNIPGGKWLDKNLGIHHSGNVFKTASGDTWLSHKVPGKLGKGGNTVITSAQHMSSNWKASGREHKVKPGFTLSDAIKAGGKNYNVFKSNCNDASCNQLFQINKHNFGSRG